MKNISLLLLAIALQAFTQAQTTIKGTVKDAITGEVLPGASIVLDNGKGTISGTAGEFSITSEGQRPATLDIHYLGYEKLSLKIPNKGSEVKLNIKLEPAVKEMEQVVVSATLSEQKMYRIPNRIHMIDARQIKNMPSQSIDQVLSIVPGVNVSRSFGIYSFKSAVTMRGHNTNEQARVLILIDGVPVNKTDGGSVNWNMIGPDEISKIEVVKGPNSTLYGSNALGGIINMVTLKPSGKLNLYAETEYGSFNTAGGRFNLSGRIKNSGFYWGINTRARQSDGYITQTGVDINQYTVETYMKEWNISTKLGYDFNNNNSIQLAYQYFDDLRGSGVKIYQADGYGTKHRENHFRGRYTGLWNGIGITANAYYLREDYIRMYEGMKDSYMWYDVDSKREDAGALVHLTKNMGKHRLTTGFDLKQGSVDAVDVYYTSTDKIFNRGKTLSAGYFLQDEIHFKDSMFLLNLGLRVDHNRFYDGAYYIENPSYANLFFQQFIDRDIQKTNWTALSPKISFQYRPSAFYRLYSSLAQGFRPSVLDDLCRAGRMSGGFKIINPKLKPEYLYNLETGADVFPSENLRFSATAYFSYGIDFMYLTNTQDSMDLGFGFRPVFQMRNVGQLYIAGIETEANWQINKYFSLNANYTYNYSEILEYSALPDITGKQLKEVPFHKAGIGYIAKWKNLKASVFAKYTGKSWIDDNNEVNQYMLKTQYPDYLMLDASIGYDFLNHFNASFNIENLTDKIVDDSKFQVNPGRFFMIKLGYKL